jgi:hypothetical protein
MKTVSGRHNTIIHTIIHPSYMMHSVSAGLDTLGRKCSIKLGKIETHTSQFNSNNT